MQIIPACTSDDLAGAVALVKVQYQKLVALGVRPFAKAVMYTTNPESDVLLCDIALGLSADQDTCTIINVNPFKLVSAENVERDATYDPVLTWSGGKAPFTVRLQARDPATGELSTTALGMSDNIDPDVAASGGVEVVSLREFTLYRAIDEDPWWADDLGSDGEAQNHIGLSIEDSSTPPRTLFAPFTPSATAPEAHLYTHYGPPTSVTPIITANAIADRVYNPATTFGDLLAFTSAVAGTFTYFLDAALTVRAESVVPSATSPFGVSPNRVVVWGKFTPADLVHYSVAVATATFTVTKAPQAITIYDDNWLPYESGSGGNGPMGGDAYYPITHALPFGAAVGTVTTSGGASGQPVTLHSTNLAVCTTSGSTIYSVAPGVVSFYLDQAGDANYFPAPRLEGDYHALIGSKTFQGSGGVVAGGAARTSRSFVRTLQGSGGAVCGGHAGSTAINLLNRVFQGSGGAVCGGAAGVIQSNSHIFQGSGGAVCGGEALISPLSLQPPVGRSFSMTQSYPAGGTTGFMDSTLYVSASRGGALSIVLWDWEPHCTPTNDYEQKLVRVAFAAHWYGTTWFEFKVQERASDGIIAFSKTYRITIQVQAPTAITYSAGISSASAGSVSWSGGSDWVTLSIVNTTSIPAKSVNLSITSYTGTGSKLCTVSNGGSWCSSGSYLRLYDVVTGQIVDIPLSSFGVPACAGASTALRIVSAYNDSTGASFLTITGGNPSIVGGVASYNFTLIGTHNGVFYPSIVQKAATKAGNTIYKLAYAAACYHPNAGVSVTDNNGSTVVQYFNSSYGPVKCSGTSASWVTVYESGCTIANSLYWVYDGELNEGTLTRMDRSGTKRVTWGFEDTGTKGGKAGTAGAHSPQVVLDRWGLLSFATLDSYDWFWPGLSAELDYWYGAGNWDLSVVHIISMEEWG